MTKTIEQTEEYRLANYYLGKLRFIHDVYKEGGDHIDYALYLLKQDWAQIKFWYQWAKNSANRWLDAAKLCSAYPRAGGIVLDIILPLKEQLTISSTQITSRLS